MPWIPLHGQLAGLVTGVWPAVSLRLVPTWWTAAVLWNPNPRDYTHLYREPQPPVGAVLVRRTDNGGPQESYTDDRLAALLLLCSVISLGTCPEPRRHPFPDAYDMRPTSIVPFDRRTRSCRFLGRSVHHQCAHQ